MTRPAIETEGLTRRFGEVTAMNGLTLAVEAGEVFGLLGHNGAGKTTILRLLNGVLDPTSGSARVLGLSPFSDGPRLRRRTGVLTEAHSLDERLTGAENLHIYADLYGVPRAEISRRVQGLLKTFQLADRADEKVGGYSKGMKQRLALARALMHDPEILFLDEPTAGLDPIAAHQAHQLIGRLSQQRKRTILLCTHNLAEAQQLCSRVAVLQRGHLLALGSPAELAQQLGLRAGIEIEVAPDDSSLALATLGDLQGIRATHGSDGVLTVVGVERERVPDLLASLVGCGVRVYRVSPQEPSLEDVYFALHGKQGGGA